MTTIAWDGKTLAADRRVSFAGVTDAAVTKILRRDDGCLCGSSGNTSLGAAFKRWFMAGEEGERPPLDKGTESVNGLIIRPNGAKIIHDLTGWYEAEPGIHGLGSGWEIAIGAMAMGASAEQAVRIAARFDGNTGEEVDVLHLHPLAAVEAA